MQQFPALWLVPEPNLCPMLLLMKNEWVDYSHGERAYISYNPYVSPQQAAQDNEY